MTSRHISAIFSVLLSLFFAGCADTRAFTDVVGGAGGALIANKLSHGNPWITAAGAGGGILASEAFHYASEKQSNQAYLSGYDKGRSDSAKQQYWLMVDRNKDDAAAQAGVLQDRRVDHTRAHNADADVMARQIGPQAPREHHHGRFGGAVRGHPAVGQIACA